MGKLGGEMKALAKHCGGSHKTVNDRLYTVQCFDHLGKFDSRLRAQGV
ncbi:hypothetical protein IH92_19530 [Salmonella enterica]|nr:hypothetical protein [Salmonella enterica]EBP0139847.1 hypothetical protein [Salmonella enterica]EDR1382521.1 hypothetical protein [Salmonella enterica subsp. diarizonae serovar 61:r:z53]EDV3184831.1 hypothetical protein [Salmonella enterica subsp. diarizonae]